ncbi:helix-turn-helix domain-containing protein, partial [Streptococcus thermophilus]|nr:helix-turn-helix domain-containing protein [Streptococcus thermophilus]
MNFSDNLKIIRQQKKMTQTDIATQLHVSRQTISSWENGRSYPDIGMLVQISMAYDFSVDQLLKGDLGM